MQTDGQISEGTVDNLEQEAAPGNTGVQETAPEESAAVTDGVESGAEGEGGEYTPNYSFKVHGEEKEFEDWAKGLVKDKETEEKFRDLMTKAYGIDHIKQDRDTLRESVTQLQEVSQKYETMQSNLDILNEYLNSGNLDSFFKTLNIPEQSIMQWAAKRIQYAEMDPAQRAEYDRAVAAQSQAVLYQHENQNISSQLEQIQHERRMFELDQHLTKPDVSGLVQEYDSRVGKPGAFREAVRERGIFHAHVNNVDIPVEQAVNEVLQMVGMNKGAQATAPNSVTQPMSQGTPGQSVAQPKAPEKKPVIPNVGGKGLSATKPVVKSIADIKRLAEQMSS